MEFTEVFQRLAMALILSGLIGIERELTHKPAGFRTHILVGVGSALIMVCSIWISLAFPERGVDPSRIAAQVVTGIGFLAGGVILQSGVSIHGLTTAASLWMTSAVGLAAGLRFYSGALLGTGFALVTLLLFNKMDFSFQGRGWTMVNLTIIANAQCLEVLEKEIQMLNLKINALNLTEESKNQGEVRIHIKEIPRARVRGFMDRLWKIKGVKKIEWN